jgi:7,8-dihydropterin-6-yl-methyl-4-(beta-D-ribofuranosyl)aminobenzene 5'-phosphate synthase
VVLPSAEEGQTVKFTVIYDNNVYDGTLRTAWGFACWVETGEKTVLFDTGGDSATLMSNIAKLDLDPQVIDAVVLSHIHGDHTGGLTGLLDTGIQPTVYVPAAFPASFKADLRARTDLVEVTGAMEIVPGIYTTGQVGSGIVEQALIVETSVGLVIATGCAHPGIVEMVRRAKVATIGGEVALVMGGFHLGSASQRQIEGIIAAFRQLGVQRIAPCHCTGDRARRMFADAYGTECTLAGVGWVMSVGSGE